MIIMICTDQILRDHEHHNNQRSILIFATMTRQQLVDQIFQKRSYLSVGLDSDIGKIPKHLLSHPDPVFEFNRQIIDATNDLCVCYKINTAFYEARGVKGWETLEKTVNYIPAGHFKIADAKRGDIGRRFVIAG